MSRLSVRPTYRLESLASSLKQKLEDEPLVLDTLASALARGQPQPELWELLHEAAVREERVAELAFAYEGLFSDRKFKFFPAAVQCDLLMHAATYFADVFGDHDAAIAYLEQVLAKSPTHREAFAKLENLLIAAQDGVRLADVYTSAAGHTLDREEQLALLWRAAEITDSYPEEQERAIRVYQSLFRIAPEDERVRRALELRYRQAGRLRDLSRLLEQSLSSASEDEASAVRERLIELYANELGEPERAVPHIEEILRTHAGHDGARRAAHRLLGHKLLAARAASALADAYERLGTIPEAAAMLAIQLEPSRGAKKAELQKRLAAMKQDLLDDAAGAFPLLEGVIAFDPTDEEARQRYGQLAESLGRQQDAARLLSRTAAGVRDPALKAKLLVETGQYLLAAGDPKRARTALTGVLSLGADDHATLVAARMLAGMFADASDNGALADVLELLARVEPDEAGRLSAAQKLAEVTEHELGDRSRAIGAWRTLLDTALHLRALEALERLYEASGAYVELISVLEERAQTSSSPEEARALALRAADLRASHTADRPGAIAALRRLISSDGPSRDAHARLLPLLELERRWELYAATLEADAELATGSERTALLLKLAQVCNSRLHDAAAALEIYRRVKVSEPSDPGLRAALEKMLAAPETRLEAATLLEPLYRSAGAAAELVRVLEARADAAIDLEERLRVLHEASEIAERDLRDGSRALGLAGKALAVAAQGGARVAGERLDRFERLASAQGEPRRRAEILAAALGSLAITDAGLLELARHAAEAHAASGDPAKAVALYRRALEFEPSSADLLERIDSLLQEEGQPEERLALYRGALSQAKTPERRREVLHAIGALQVDELGDIRGAISTWSRALEDDPEDREAREALLRAYERVEEWGLLYAELERLRSVAPAEARFELVLRLGRVARMQGAFEKALGHCRELLGESGGDERVLCAIEELAEASGDAATGKLALERRIEVSTDPQDQCTWLEREAELLAGRLGQPEAAVERWKKAARIAEERLGDKDRALRCYESAHRAVPDDRDAALALRRLYLSQQSWPLLGDIFDVLVRTARDDAARVQVLLEIEPHLSACGYLDAWLAHVAAVLAGGGASPELALARARALAAEPVRADDASVALRELLEAKAVDPQPVLHVFEAFLASFAEPQQRKEDRRYLLSYAATHARTDAQRVSSLLAWARAEEQSFGDEVAALSVYRQVVDLAREHTDALEAVARLELKVGDAESALRALLALRDQSEGSARRERELAVADLLSGRLGRMADALEHVAPLLDANPADADAIAIAARALSDRIAAAPAAALLEKVAAAHEDEEHTLRILGMLIDMPSSPELEQSRRRWFGVLLDARAADPEAALAIALRAVAEAPDDESLWGRAEKLARALGRPEDVARAYQSALRQRLPADLALELGRRAVDYYEEWFEEPETVLELLGRVLELAPDASWARDRLKLAFSSSERWSDLFLLYDRAIERANDEASRGELLLEAGQAAKDFASDWDRAIGYFERLLAQRGDDRWVKQLLERLYEKQNRVEPLVALWTSDLPSLQGEAAQRLRVRIADLVLRERGDLPAAFKLIEEMLSLEPGRAEAYELLERIVFAPGAATAEGEATSDPPGGGVAADAAAEGAEVGALEAAPAPLTTTSRPPERPSSVPASSKASRRKRRPNLRDRSALILKERYTSEGRMGDLARVLEVELASVVAPKDRIRRHEELLTLRLDTLDDAAGAFEHAASLVELDPRAAGHRKTLLSLADRLGWHERLVSVLLAAANDAGDPALSARLLAEVAVVCRDKLQDIDRAIASFERVLELSPKDREFALGAAHDLDALLAQTTRVSERCAVLERIAKFDADPAACRGAVELASDLALSALGDPDRAVETWRSYAKAHPAEGEALDGLARVLRRTERHGDLAELLEARSRETTHPDKARQDAVELAALYAQKLRSPERAIQTWLRVREELGAGADSFAPLAALLDSQRRWEDLAQLVLDEIRRVLSPDEQDRRARFAEMRAVVEKTVRATDRATSQKLCRAVFEAGAALLRDSSAAVSESQLVSDSALWALDQVVRVALDSSDNASAAKLLLDGAALALEPGRARGLRQRAAAVMVERMGDPRGAIAVLAELWSENDRDAVADAIGPELARLYAEAGLPAELAELWERQARRQADGGNARLAGELWSKAADLWEKRLGDTDRAIADYRLSGDLGNPMALRDLARIFTARRDFLAAAAVLERVCQLPALETLSQDTLALANAYLAAGERDRARSTLERGAAALGRPGVVRAKLAELYREERTWDKLAELLRVEADDAGDRETRLALLRQAAAIHLEQRDDPASGASLLEQVRKLDPDDSATVLTLSRALSRVKRPEDASSALRDLIERFGTRKPKDRALLHFELARLSLLMGERARALAELAQASKIDPAHPEILNALGDLALEEGQLERAQRTFRALLLVLGGARPSAAPVSRASVLIRLAAIAEREDKPDQAKDLVDSALHAATESDREAEALERLLRESGRFDLLARSLENRLATATGLEQRAKILAELTALYLDKLELAGDLRERLRGEADRVAADLGGVGCAVEEAFQSLESVYARLGDTDRQSALLVRHVELLEQNPSAISDPEPWYRLAGLRFAQRETHPEAVSFLERALDIRLDADRAEQLLSGALEIDPGYERAARLYERVARQSGRAGSLVRALSGLSTLGLASASQIRELFALLVRAEDLARAEEVLTRAVEAGTSFDAPDWVFLRTSLADLGEARGDQARAADLREEAATRAAPDEQRSLLVSVARAATDKLGDLGRAARVYAAVRARDPADRELWEPLLDVYRRLGDSEQIVKLIADTLPLIESSSERSVLRLEQIAILLKSDDQRAHATNLLRDLLDDDPGQVQAAFLLARLLEEGGHLDELTDLLSRQLDYAKDRADRESIESLSMRLGALLAQRHRPAEALDVYHAVLDWSPDSRQALGAILRLSEATGDDFDVADALEKLLAVESGDAAVALAQRLLAFRVGQQDEEGADRAAALGFRAAPSNAELRAEVTRRCQARGGYGELAQLLKLGFDQEPDNRELLEILLDTCRRAERFEPAVEALGRAIERAPREARLLRERATFYEALGRWDEAMQDYERAHIEGGAEYAGDLVLGLTHHAERLGAPADRAIKVKLGQILSGLGDWDGARAQWAELLRRDGKDRELLRLLAELEEKAGQWAAASTMWRRLLSLEEGAVLVDVAEKLAEACAKAGRPADARAGLERALKVSPGHLAIRSRLKEVYEQTGAHRELAELVLEEASRQGDVAGRFAQLLRAGALLLAAEGDPGKAVSVLEEARSLRPEEDEAVLLLGRAYGASARDVEALRLLEDTLGARKGKRSREIGAMYRELSRLRQKAGDRALAVQALGKAIDNDLPSGEAGLEVGLIALELEDTELAGRAFRSVTFMKPVQPGGEGATSSAKARAYYQLAKMAARAGDTRKARILTHKALTEDPAFADAKEYADELKGG